MSEIIGYIITAFSPINLLFALMGTVVGITVGALPGFTPTMGIAVLIPITYSMDPTTALVFLGAIYCGSMFGGSISAILINTPGHQRRRRHRHGRLCHDGEGQVPRRAGRGVGGLLLGRHRQRAGPHLPGAAPGQVAFQFGPQEKFMMALFGLTIIASLSTKDVLKGLMMGCVGLVVACIGMDPMQGQARFTFGNHFLMGGITMIPAVIGLFSVSQIFTTIKDPIVPADKSMIAQFKAAKIHLKDLVRYPVVYLRSAIIGIVVGIIPGTGGDVASYVSHNTGRMFSKEEDFGHGAREGVACCEAANNAVTGGTLIPTLTLGVPGNATTAVLLSGLTIHGLTPGYGLFTTEKQITYPFICALFIANLMMVLIGMFGAKHFAKVTLTPKNILSAFVLSLSIMGTYAVRGNLRDVVVMLVFGVIGYILKLYKYNVVPIVLGLILGPIAEAGLSQALLLNSNSLSATLGTLFVRPICVVLMAPDGRLCLRPLHHGGPQGKQEQAE